MRIDNMIQSLRVLARADAMIAEAALKARLSEIMLRATAFSICLFGLFMLGIAVFFALQDLWGTIWAAVAVGSGSLALSAWLSCFPPIAGQEPICRSHMTCTRWLSTPWSKKLGSPAAI